MTKDITFYNDIIEAQTNSIWTGIEFAKLVAEKRNKQENIPPYTFRSQVKKILEEVKEYSFAVDSNQGNPKDHTRNHQVEEGLDVHFATLSSYDVLKITKEEVREAVITEIKKFQSKGWLE